MSVDKKALGKFGEDAATDYLEKKKYKILCRNFSTKFGELDIIAKYKGDIIFIEVKTRINDKFGTPAQAVTYYKQQKILRCAKGYIAENNLKHGSRFDVIEVYAEPSGESYKLNKINHIEGAFNCDGVYM